VENAPERGITYDADRPEQRDQPDRNRDVVLLGLDQRPDSRDRRRAAHRGADAEQQREWPAHREPRPEPGDERHAEEHDQDIDRQHARPGLDEFSEVEPDAHEHDRRAQQGTGEEAHAGLGTLGEPDHGARQRGEQQGEAERTQDLEPGQGGQDPSHAGERHDERHAKQEQ
jgi:hypothetical protein